MSYSEREFRTTMGKTLPLGNPDVIFPNEHQPTMFPWLDTSPHIDEMSKFYTNAILFKKDLFDLFERQR